jgi:hypothetical protein
LHAVEKQSFKHGVLTCVPIHVQVVRMGADTTVGVMERAMEAGHSVLIENMGESVDAVLLPIITRSTVKKGRNLFVKLGDKDVEYNRNFKLFMHTKLSNPHYPPEIQAETTLINFTVTEKVRQQRHADYLPLTRSTQVIVTTMLLPLRACCNLLACSTCCAAVFMYSCGW